MVKDLRKYGAFVHVVETDTDDEGAARVGVVCDVVDARAGDGAGAVLRGNQPLGRVDLNFAENLTRRSA